MKSLILIPVVCVVMFLPGELCANETQIYESLDDVSIGRIFFTKAERERLDRLRGSRHSIATADRSRKEESSGPDEDKEANGFILRSDGKARVYRNGDFVVVNASPVVEFHDEVTVKRKPDGRGNDAPE